MVVICSTILFLLEINFKNLLSAYHTPGIVLEIAMNKTTKLPLFMNFLFHRKEKNIK